MSDRFEQSSFGSSDGPSRAYVSEQLPQSLFSCCFLRRPRSSVNPIVNSKDRLNVTGDTKRDHLADLVAETETFRLGRRDIKQKETPATSASPITPNPNFS